MRLPSSQAAAQQRSINLAMSARGIAAIEAIEPSAADRFLKAVIPMHGRMIHDVKGNQESQLYDKDGQVSSLDSRRSIMVNLISICKNRVPRISQNTSQLVHQLDWPCFHE